MKTNIQVYVLREFAWKGQTYQPGALIQLSVPDALALGKKKHITVTKKKAFVAAAPVPVQEPTPEPVIETPKRRTYKRRDIQPTETAEITPQAPEDPRADAPES